MTEAQWAGVRDYVARNTLGGSDCSVIVYEESSSGKNRVRVGDILREYDKLKAKVEQLEQEIGTILEDLL